MEFESNSRWPQSSSEEEDESGGLIEEEDFVTNVLRRQRRKADAVAPEDAMVSAVPGTARRSVTNVVPASAPLPSPPPPPPPPLAAAEFDEPPSEGAPPGPPNALSSFHFSLDALLCGAGGSLALFRDKVEGEGAPWDKGFPRDPNEFAPNGGALFIEVRRVSAEQSGSIFLHSSRDHFRNGRCARWRTFRGWRARATPWP
jgi:hypothetical protein